MKEPIFIHKLSAEMGLTSRTLRHWEAEGLFASMRDQDSGWRKYGENAFLAIRITALLRQLDIPIRDIKLVLEEKSYKCLNEVVQKQIGAFKASHHENLKKERRLNNFLAILDREKTGVLIDSGLSKWLTEMEKTIMSNNANENNDLNYVTLPPMRIVYHIAVGLSPEEDAMVPVMEWIESARLSGTARFFGGNMEPWPSGEGKPYGYGMMASIPEGIDIPDHLREMHAPGGVYAVLESTDDIQVSWQKLMKGIKEDGRYVSDRSRFCYEEHIQKDGGGFLLTLMEPVKAK